MKKALKKSGLKLQTRATGLEPATSGSTGRRSNQLSYAPFCEFLNLGETHSLSSKPCSSFCAVAEAFAIESFSLRTV